jgi:hypothetical protein
MTESLWRDEHTNLSVRVGSEEEKDDLKANAPAYLSRRQWYRKGKVRVAYDRKSFKRQTH